MFKVLNKDNDSRARAGEIYTAHGVLETPSYAIVGTHGFVKGLNAEKLMEAGAEILMMNTYHLWRDMGEDRLKNFSGLHEMSNWQKPIMTDSGGFQVFSLGVAKEQNVGKIGMSDGNSYKKNSAVVVNENGVRFEDEGIDYFLSPEKSIWIQEALGADIIFAFDDPSSPLESAEKTRERMERTHRWAKRCLETKSKNGQLLYGIVQGGPYEELRKESAKTISEMPFDGFALGGAFGSSFGDSKEVTYRELDWAVPFLPEGKPRHLLGIGKIEDVFKGVEAGIDTFDCVVPTREGRHGGVWTSKGRVNVLASQYKNDENLLENGCECFSCEKRKITRGELRAYFKTGKGTKEYGEAEALGSIHNIYFFSDLMKKIREAIKDDRYSDFQEKYLSGII